MIAAEQEQLEALADLLERLEPLAVAWGHRYWRRMNKALAMSGPPRHSVRVSWADRLSGPTMIGILTSYSDGSLIFTTTCPLSDSG